MTAKLAAPPPIVLVLTLYLVTRWPPLGVGRPCVATPSRSSVAPASICIHCPWALVPANHAFALLSLERAVPVPIALLAYTLE